MPDPTLHGNGYHCPACELRRAEACRRSAFGPRDIPCNRCNGTGRIAYSLRETYERQLADARAFYWSMKTYA